MTFDNIHTSTVPRAKTIPDTRKSLSNSAVEGPVWDACPTKSTIVRIKLMPKIRQTIRLMSSPKIQGGKHKIRTG